MASVITSVVHCISSLQPAALCNQLSIEEHTCMDMRIFGSCSSRIAVSKIRNLSAVGPMGARRIIQDHTILIGLEHFFFRHVCLIRIR